MTKKFAVASGGRGVLAAMWVSGSKLPPLGWTLTFHLLSFNTPFTNCPSLRQHQHQQWLVMHYFLHSAGWRGDGCEARRSSPQLPAVEFPPVFGSYYKMIM
jgi:hypothetical protein